MSNWQSLDTAPLGKWALYAYDDGTIIKAMMINCWASCHEKQGDYPKLHIVDGSGDGEWCHPHLTGVPTHWQPLPEPPAP